MYSFPDMEPACCSILGSDCCFLTCIQISQEASKVVWYSHFFKNFSQFVVIHTVKGFWSNQSSRKCFSGIFLHFREWTVWTDYLVVTQNFVGRVGFLPEDPSYVAGKAMESVKKHSGDLAELATWSFHRFPYIFTMHLPWFSIAWMDLCFLKLTIFTHAQLGKQIENL